MSPASGHAVVPSGFRFQVGPMTQKSSSELLLSLTGIQRCVPRRTLSLHPAPGFIWDPVGSLPRVQRLPYPRSHVELFEARLPDVVLGG
jgi:hypothetical protein